MEEIIKLTEAERRLFDCALDPESADDLATAREDVLKERMPSDIKERFIEAYKPTLIARAQLAKFYRETGLDVVRFDKAKWRRECAAQLGLPVDGGEAGSWFLKDGEIRTEEEFQRMREARAEKKSG